MHASSPEMETLYLSFVDLSKDCRNITFGYKFHFNKKVNLGELTHARRRTPNLERKWYSESGNMVTETWSPHECCIWLRQGLRFNNILLSVKAGAPCQQSGAFG